MTAHWRAVAFPKYVAVYDSPGRRTPQPDGVAVIRVTTVSPINGRLRRAHLVRVLPERRWKILDGELVPEPPESGEFLWSEICSLADEIEVFAGPSVPAAGEQHAEDRPVVVDDDAVADGSPAAGDEVVEVERVSGGPVEGVVAGGDVVGPDEEVARGGGARGLGDGPVDVAEQDARSGPALPGRGGDTPAEKPEFVHDFSSWTRAVQRTRQTRAMADFASAAAVALGFAVGRLEHALAGDGLTRAEQMWLLQVLQAPNQRPGGGFRG